MITYSPKFIRRKELDNLGIAGHVKTLNGYSFICRSYKKTTVQCLNVGDVLICAWSYWLGVTNISLLEAIVKFKSL